jgi:hypothetical protein
LRYYILSHKALIEIALNIHAQLDAMPQIMRRPDYLKIPLTDKVPRRNPARSFPPVGPNEG